MGSWDMRSDKSYKDPLEYEDASSVVSNEEDIEDPLEIVESSPMEDEDEDEVGVDGVLLLLLLAS